ncbi:OBP3-responsive protein 4 (ORG4) [Carex rostrata]
MAMRPGGAGVEATAGGEPIPIEEAYTINVVPSELYLKFRKELRNLRVGLNLEFFNYEVNDYEAKLVLKPLSTDRRWKFMYRPVHGDVQVLSKKIPLTKYLNLQVGIGHSFQLNAIGWKWKISTCLGGDGVSQIRNKTNISFFPGFDLRIGWKAEYVLPDIHGGMGTGEPVFNMNYGKLNASIDRIEAILTS